MKIIKLLYFKKAIFILTITLLLFGCADTESLEKKIGFLEAENKSLKVRIEQLEAENKQLKETDEFYWRSAIDFIKDHNYAAAVEKLAELKDKFPNTKLMPTILQKLNEINKVQNKLYAELLRTMKKADLDVKIAEINNFLSKGFTTEYKIKARTRLTAYEKQYENFRKEREFEISTGIRIMQIDARWRRSGSISNLLHPYVHIKIKNVSNKHINPEITIEYVDSKNKEIFDNVFTLVGSIKPGYSRTAVVNPATGYQHAFFLPTLTANISVNGKFVRAVTVK